MSNMTFLDRMGEIDASITNMWEAVGKILQEENDSMKFRKNIKIHSVPEFLPNIIDWETLNSNYDFEKQVFVSANRHWVILPVQDKKRMLLKIEELEAWLPLERVRHALKRKSAGWRQWTKTNEEDNKKYVFFGCEVASGWNYALYATDENYIIIAYSTKIPENLIKIISKDKIDDLIIEMQLLDDQELMRSCARRTENKELKAKLEKIMEARGIIPQEICIK